MKPYICRVAQVCRRWEIVARWKSNPHFWQTSLTLRLFSNREEDRDEFSLHNHRICTVTRFRHALSTAEDSDISLSWDCYSRDNMSTSDRTTWSRIFMHCVSMLSKNSSQLVYLHLRFLNDHEYGFAKAFLTGLESPRGLQTLSTRSCGAASSTETSISTSDIDGAVF